MHEVLYFVHLTALAIWLGSLVALAWWCRSALQAPEAGIRTWALQLVNQLTVRVAVPASVLVLLAGLSMAALSGASGADRPLWLQVMEEGGGMLILVSLGLVPWLSKRVRRAADNRAALQRAVRNYVAGMASLAVGVAGVLLTVSLRLG